MNALDPVVLDEQKHDREQGDGDAQIANVVKNLIAAFNESGTLPFYVEMALKVISEEIGAFDAENVIEGSEAYEVIEIYVTENLDYLAPYLDRTQ